MRRILTVAVITRRWRDRGKTGEFPRGDGGMARPPRERVAAVGITFWSRLLRSPRYCLPSTTTTADAAATARLLFGSCGGGSPGGSFKRQLAPSPECSLAARRRWRGSHIHRRRPAPPGILRVRDDARWILLSHSTQPSLARTRSTRVAAPRAVTLFITTSRRRLRSYHPGHRKPVISVFVCKNNRAARRYA